MSGAQLARYERGMSIEQAAQEASVHPRTIYRIEKGETKPSAETARALADVYGCSVAVIMGVDSPVDSRRRRGAA